jgi:hypothetical protein
MDWKFKIGLVDPSLQARLNPTIEKQATTFFFRNFILPASSREETRGFLEVAASMSDGAAEDSPLALATEALAISSIANWPGRRHLSSMAARLYGRALAATRKAIMNPQEATSDATLVAILLFSLYESITSSEHTTLAWGKHIDGAVAIARARGLQQFQDPQSLLLFRAVRTQMITNAIQSQTAIADFPGPRGWLSDMDTQEPIPFSSIEYSIKLPDLLSRGKRLSALPATLETDQLVENLLEEAHHAAQEYSKWQAQLPAHWGYKSVATCSGDVATSKIEELEVWPGPMHMYKNVHISSTRNNNRIVETLYWSIVIDALKRLQPSNYETDARYRLAKNRIQALVDDVCHSVPFHLWGQELGEKARPDGQNREGEFAMQLSPSMRLSLTKLQLLRLSEATI